VPAHAPRPRDASGLRAAEPKTTFALPVPIARDLTLRVQLKGKSLLLGETNGWFTIGTRKGHGSWIAAFGPLQWQLVHAGAIEDGRQQFSVSAGILQGDAMWRIRVERDP